VAQRVRAAKANLEKARLDLRTLEVRSSIDRELLKLAAEEAQAAWQEAQRALTLVADRQRAELRLLDLARERQERHRNRHREDVRRFTIQSPMNGQVVMKTVMRAGNLAQVRVGDELGTGQPFLRVVDLSSMQLDATLNQTESELVHIGQPATVRFDAFPDLVLEAHVESVGALALSSGRRVSNYVRQIPVRLSIEGSDSRVIPDLTASADVVFAQQDEALIVPREAVHEEDGKFIVYVKQAESFAAREVALGVASATQVAVLSGLEAGEEIALQPLQSAN
jgi:multidrug resistance efflux pump